ncbi:MAG: sulfotransferase domain-containing protein [Geminicoccaceae bacterium]
MCATGPSSSGATPATSRSPGTCRGVFPRRPRSPAAAYSIGSLEEFGLSVEQDRERIRIFRYEDFAKDNRKFLEDLLDYVAVALPEDAVAALYERHAFKQVTGGREAGVEEPHDHDRKGVSRDWRNYFDPPLCAYFREVTGDLLDVLGYAEAQAGRM